MKIAVLGPVCIDEVDINGKKHYNLGGIPFYVGKTLQALGVKCTLFITHAEKDKKWVYEQLNGIDIVHIPSEKTLTSRMKYLDNNPDERIHEIIYTPSSIKPKDVAHLLEDFDYIIMGPLFYDDIDDELFHLLKHKKIVLGNFGMFNYAEGNKMIKKHPERAIAVLSNVDFLFLDDKEVMFVSQKYSVEGAVSELQKHVKNIIITKGSKGSELFIGEKKFVIPAYSPKKLIDPTGAGDSYLAGFIAGLEFFDDYQKIGEFAAMTATASIEQKGPLKLSKEEIIQRLGWNE